MPSESFNFVIGPIGLGLLLTSCGGSQDRQIAQMEQEIRILRDRSARLEERVVDLEQTATPLASAPSSGRPDLEVVKLEPPETDEDEPGTPEANQAFSVAMGLYEDRKFDEALSAFDSFVGRFPVDPRRQEARLYQGKACLEVGRPKDAASLFEAIAKTENDQTTAAFEGLVEAYMQLGDAAGVQRAKAEVVARR